MRIMLEPPYKNKKNDNLLILVFRPDLLHTMVLQSK